MIYLFGNEVKVTDEQTCHRSSTDHKKLVHAARVDRDKRQFNVDESYVLCTSCGLALSLKL